jgi:hypothetical protein
MAWEQRGSSRFYYRSRRADGRVTREYCGNALFGAAAALEDESARARRAERKAMTSREQQEHRSALNLQADVDRALDQLVSKTLAAAGFHQHKNGEWRKKRGSTKAQS